MKFLRSSFATLLFAVLPAIGQEPAPAPSAPPAPPPTEVAKPEPSKTEPPKPLPSRVIWVRGPGSSVIHLGEDVSVAVQGYGELDKSARAHPKPITLWLNGLDFDLEPTGVVTLPAANVPKDSEGKPLLTPEQREDARVLTFHLQRTTENSNIWRDLLRNPLERTPKQVYLSVGVAGDKPVLLHEQVTGLPLSLHKTRFTWESFVSALLFLLTLVLLWIYRSQMLRNGPDVNNQKQAYSLGRSQMAFWFILILASYIVIWLITGDRDTLTTSSLVLMGISAATAMGAVAIEAGAPARVNDVRKELEAEKVSLLASPAVKAVAANSATPEETAAASAIDMRVAEIDQTIANLTKPPMTSNRYMTDILTDNNGMVALHRFQIVMWTLVLGVVFVASVVRDLSMPEFNPTLLALMGISAGTYLGFKLPTNGG